jgi:branched-chain amino acid transport system substrate-binding protein
MRRMTKAASWFVCICFLVLLVIWGVQPAQAAAEKKEILIGTHLSLSGVQAAVVMHQKWAYERAVEEVNKAGGIFVKEYNKKLPVRLIEVDDESNQTQAAAAVERLIKRDKVDLLLSGQTGAISTVPGMVTAEKYKVYYHACVMWPQEFLSHNFKWGTMFFFDPMVGSEMTFKVWQALPEDQRPKKPAVISEDTMDGKIVGDGWEAAGKKYGYTFAERLPLTMGAKDFTSQVLKAKEAGVDAAFCLADTPQIVTFLRQAKENKYNIKWFQGFKGTWSPDFYKAMGKDANYILADGFWSMDYPYKGVRDSSKELGEAWHKKFGNYSVTVGLFYATANILFQAIEKAGTLDSAKVREAVLSNTFDTVMGKVKYDDKGVALFPAADFQWWNGKQELIFPLELAKYKVKPMPPWDNR